MGEHKPSLVACHRVLLIRLAFCHVALAAALASTSVLHAEGSPWPFSESRDFDGLKAGPLPMNWATFGGAWSIAGGATTNVLQQTQEPLYQEAFALAAWSGYEVETQVLLNSALDSYGFGLVGHWQSASAHYRLAVINNVLYLLKVHDGYVSPLQSANCKIDRGLFYHLKLRITPSADGVLLQGKVWQDQEPAPWSLEIKDVYQPATHGRPGLWAAHADCHFLGFALRQVSATGSAETGPSYVMDLTRAALGSMPPEWSSLRGRWMVDQWQDRRTLRQVSADSGPDFDDNAFALMVPSSYTVSARVKLGSIKGGSGFGVVAYFTGLDHHYRLRAIGNQLYLTKRWSESNNVNLANAGYRFKANEWYRFTLKVLPLKDTVQLLGKVCQQNTEPDEWTLVAEDSSQPLQGGDAGLWVFDSPCSFDQFAVTPNSP